MTNLRILPSLVLIAVLLAACAPAASTVIPTQLPAVEPDVTLPPQTTDVPASSPVPTDAQAATPLPVATSRGPDLHATDPSTVSLASGGLQLVEFFRFT
jgi:hypothetical protein